MRYDTLLHFSKGSDRTWEIALADGTYTIDLFCGDDDNTDSINSIDVEGVLFEDTDGEDNFDEWLGVPVTVSDGKLTIKPDATADNAKILFIHITAE